MATVDELCENFTKVGLTRECEKLGLPAIGGKRDIAKKIINHRNMTNSGGENGEDDRDPQKDGVCEKDDSHTEDAERGVVGSCEKDGSHSDNEERAERDGFSTNGEDDEADNDDSEDNESDDMFQTAIRTNTSTPLANRLRASRRTKVYSFRDMEESIESFGAEEGEDVRLWLMQLKGVCKAARWDDEQQLIMCRKKLTGTAKRFVFSLRSSFSSFKKLEQALIREFAPRVRASDVHRALTNRKKKNSESIRDYIYEMQRLALPIELDEPSLCEYIVNGITDDEHHQTILYEAQSIERLKRKLLNFERVMKDSKNKKKRDDFGNRKEKAREKENNTMSKKRSCFNCGETSHVSADCPQKGAGPKCFSCNTFGHRARECKKGGTSSQKEKQNVLICGPSVEPNHSEHPPSSVTKWEDEFTSKRSSEKQVWLQRTIIQVKVESVIIDALFDTGSPMNLMTHYTYEKIGKPCLSTTTMKLKGFGGNEIAADGVFQVDMCIDCHQYRDVLFYLVPNKSMSFAAVLGTASLQHFDVKVTTNGVQVLKREECEIMDIMLCENEIDVPKQYASEVKSLISNYVPCEDVKSTVEMKILLEDEHPVQTNPRRFAPKEKEVLEKTVNEWLNAGIIRESNSDYASPVDALSRAIMIVTNDPVVEMIITAQKKDERISAIRQLLTTQPYDDYCMNGEVVMKLVKGKEVIVVPVELQGEIIRRAHENGHFGVRKLEDMISRDYYIPNLSEKIKRKIECCVKCLIAERKRGKIDGMLYPIEKGEVPFDTYHVDHVGPMAVTDKMYKYIFVVVDAFTKYTWIYPTKTTASNEVIQRLRNQSEMFGNPRRIVSDKGSAFTSNSFKQYCEEENIEHIEIVTGVPRGNGQVERANQVILAMLTKLCVNDSRKWYKHVGDVQKWINLNVHQSTRVTPFQAMFGVTMRHKEDLRLSELMEEIRVARFHEERSALRAQARSSIERAQATQKRNYDLRARSSTKYEVGDVVVVQRSQFNPGMKTAPQFLGPYKVVEKMPNDRYKVEKISGEGSQHTTTASSQMKKYRVEVTKE
ncbi:uncharacterized protein LOC118515170 [Anopheles stephensi]|uniref:uncharacterized protein LOC118504451 n=1 Tax=Anopheles stephensi TaxID=30069 RepID=UPI0016588E1A|nr:uncharacterized protein LOC118504451 [Anopheles stephensi]XP_035914828.1 uncharacterized protein LOC118513324 [Anopheles stephensi]XP_035917768.1 uncharacterized protein LOC118515170 [Anopheles stephensi]